MGRRGVAGCDVAWGCNRWRREVGREGQQRGSEGDCRRRQGGPEVDAGGGCGETAKDAEEVAVKSIRKEKFI